MITTLNLRSLFPLSMYLVGVPGAEGRLSPEHNFSLEQCEKYLASGYWTENEEDVWWYYYLWFPYAIYSPTAYFNGRVGWLNTIKEIFKLVGMNWADYYSDDTAQSVLDKLPYLEEHPQFGKIFELEALILSFFENIDNKKAKSQVMKKFKWIKQLRKSRERQVFYDVKSLKFCFAYVRSMDIGLITVQHLRAIFNMSEEKIPTEQLMAILGDCVKIIDAKPFLHLDLACRQLLRADLLPSEYLNINTYIDNNDWRTNAAYFHLINIVRQQMIGRTEWQPEPKTIPFSEFAIKAISESDILYAAQNQEIGIYVRGEVELKLKNTHDCLLFHGKADTKALNIRPKNLMKIQVDGSEYLNKNEHGLTVKMLRESKKPSLSRSDWHPPRGDISYVCNILGLPNETEAAFGVEPSVTWQNEQIENYKDHVVILETEWIKFRQNDKTGKNTTFTENLEKLSYAPFEDAQLKNFWEVVKSAEANIRPNRKRQQVVSIVKALLDLLKTVDIKSDSMPCPSIEKFIKIIMPLSPTCFDDVDNVKNKIVNPNRNSQYEPLIRCNGTSGELYQKLQNDIRIIVSSRPNK